MLVLPLRGWLRRRLDPLLHPWVSAQTLLQRSSPRCPSHAASDGSKQYETVLPESFLEMRGYFVASLFTQKIIKVPAWVTLGPHLFQMPSPDNYTEIEIVALLRQNAEAAGRLRTPGSMARTGLYMTSVCLQYPDYSKASHHSHYGARPIMQPKSNVASLLIPLI